MLPWGRKGRQYLDLLSTAAGVSREKTLQFVKLDQTIFFQDMSSITFVLSRKNDNDTWNMIYFISESNIKIEAFDILDVIAKAENFA